MARAASYARAAIGLLLLGGHATARGGELVDPTPRQSWSGATARGLLGYTLASADVDGDGAADLVAGNPGCDGPGAVVVYAHDGAGFAAEPSYLLPGIRMDGEIGRQLTAGDFDGDGADDVLAGGPCQDSIGLYYGSASGPGGAVLVASVGLPELFPGATDVPGDGIDQDCNGVSAGAGGSGEPTDEPACGCGTGGSGGVAGRYVGVGGAAASHRPGGSAFLDEVPEARELLAQQGFDPHLHRHDRGRAG